jgi:hypothetical protein
MSFFLFCNMCGGGNKKDEIDFTTNKSFISDKIEKTNLPKNQSGAADRLNENPTEEPEQENPMEIKLPKDELPLESNEVLKKENETEKENFPPQFRRDTNFTFLSPEMKINLENSGQLYDHGKQDIIISESDFDKLKNDFRIEEKKFMGSTQDLEKIEIDEKKFSSTGPLYSKENFLSIEKVENFDLIHASNNPLNEHRAIFENHDFYETEGIERSGNALSATREKKYYNTIKKITIEEPVISGAKNIMFKNYKRNLAKRNTASTPTMQLLEPLVNRSIEHTFSKGSFDNNNMLSHRSHKSNDVSLRKTYEPGEGAMFKCYRPVSISIPASYSSQIGLSSSTKDESSCLYCEKLYKDFLISGEQIKIAKCNVCFNPINEGSLDFYFEKYKNQILEEKHKSLNDSAIKRHSNLSKGRNTLKEKNHNLDFNNLVAKTELKKDVHISPISIDKKHRTIPTPQETEGDILDTLGSIQKDFNTMRIDKPRQDSIKWNDTNSKHMQYLGTRTQTRASTSKTVEDTKKKLVQMTQDAKKNLNMKSISPSHLKKPVKRISTILEAKENKSIAASRKNVTSNPLLKSLPEFSPNKKEDFLIRQIKLRMYTKNITNSVTKKTPKK